MFPFVFFCAKEMSWGVILKKQEAEIQDTWRKYTEITGNLGFPPLQ